MTELQFETDEKLKALSEALRAGPGSPQWREAVSQWSAAETAARESEHQLLLRVREHLASGKGYREIRAGAGFTRLVMEGIDQEEANRSARMTGGSAAWIAAISALVIIGVVAMVAFIVWPRPDKPAPAPSPASTLPANLERTRFVTTIESSTFIDSISPQWQTFGSLTLTADGALRPLSETPTPTPALAPAPGSTEPGFKGGGIYYDLALPADQPFSIETSIAIRKNSKDVVVQVFVTDQRDFEGKSSTTPHELAWTLKDGEGNIVLPDGRVEGNTFRAGGGSNQSVDLRMALNQTDGVVEVNGQRLWTGAHHLDPKRPRTIGIRFLGRERAAGTNALDRLSVQNVRILR